MNNRFAKKVVLAVLSFSMLLCQACSAPTPVPSPTPEEFVPAPAVVAQNAKIAVYSFDEVSVFGDIVKRVNETLRSAGQNVEFEARQAQYQQGNNSVFLDAVKAELAAGKPTADAYPFNFIESKTLKDAGLSMDITNLVRQNAPVYYSKYSNLFPEQLYGVPVGISSHPMWMKTALMLRNDFLSSGSSISTTESLLNFLDEAAVSPKKSYSIMAYPSELVMQWALEQGYYNLSMFGIDGYLLAAIDDPTFTPVTIESIPGFGNFLTKLNQYYRNQSLCFPYSLGNGREGVGYLKILSGYYATSIYSGMPVADGEYTALPFSPELPSYFEEPVYVNELVIPALCPVEKAGQMIRFAEWLYSSQETYDSIVYGKESLDFSGTDGRYVPLVDGKQLNTTNFDQLHELFFAWPGAQYLFNMDYTRLSADAPSNVEELLADGIRQNHRFPLGDRIKTDRETIDTVFDTTDEMKTLCKQRNDLLNTMMYGEPMAFTEQAMKFNLDKLAQFKNTWLISQYQGIMKKITENQ